MAALALKESGYDVAAVTLRLWPGDDERACCSPGAVHKARESAHALGAPHFTLNEEAAFDAGVVEPFVKSHVTGETPNPCIECNPLRFERLVQLANRFAARWIATGHYARLVRRGDRLLVARGRDRDKDQSYMLWRLGQPVLERLLLPLGESSKDEVRALAREALLPVADEPESQEVCFAAGDHCAFLAARGLEGSSGEIVDLTGTVLGHHDGYWRFTVGQRRGLGVSSSAALYVLRVDPDDGRVVVGRWSDLLTHEVRLRELVDYELGDGAGLQVQLRYRSGAIGVGRLRRLPADRALVTLKQPFAGPAPGQSAVFYRDDVVVGGGIIDSPEGLL